MGFFIWEEERLQARGYVTTYVLSHGSRTRAICRRQCRSTLEGILKNCQASGLETLPELKAFVKKGGTEDVDIIEITERFEALFPTFWA